MRPRVGGHPQGKVMGSPSDMVPLSGTGRVQEELGRVLGPGRLPRPEDQRALPYTNAVLHEAQRYITLLPHVPRCTAADTRLGGYLLPKVRAQLGLILSIPLARGWSGLLDSEMPSLGPGA